MAETTVGIDIGSTSVKALAADGDGNVLASFRVPHELRIPAADEMEHDATRAWRRGPRRALSGILGTFRALGDHSTRAVCVAAMVPSMTGVDRRGIPRTPGLLYGDARGSDGGTMSPAESGEAVRFLSWTAREMPNARGYWPAQAVANYALSGEPALDSGTAITLNELCERGQWDQEKLSSAGLSVAQMPRIVGIGEPAAKVGDAILASGTVDALGEQIVAGADEDGDVLVVCGTTLVLWVVQPEMGHQPRLWTVPHTTAGKWLVGGASNSGGLFINWARSLVGPVRGHAEPGRIPIWLPYPRGERTPYHDPARRAVLFDLDLTHDAAAVERAAYEAGGFVIRHHLELAGIKGRRIVATGGGTRVPGWLQALADCTGLVVDVVAVAEGGALGAAFTARVAAGLETSIVDARRWSRISHTVEPDPVWQRAADERYARFREETGAPGGAPGPKGAGAPDPGVVGMGGV